jgi:hypothetical protein
LKKTQVNKLLAREGKHVFICTITEWVYLFLLKQYWQCYELFNSFHLTEDPWKIDGKPVENQRKIKENQAKMLSIN